MKRPLSTKSRQRDLTRLSALCTRCYDASVGLGISSICNSEPIHTLVLVSQLIFSLNLDRRLTSSMSIFRPFLFHLLSLFLPWIFWQDKHGVPCRLCMERQNRVEELFQDTEYTGRSHYQSHEPSHHVCSVMVIIVILLPYLTSTLR